MQRRLQILSSNLCIKLCNKPKVEAGNDDKRMKLKDKTASGETSSECIQERVVVRDE